MKQQGLLQKHRLSLKSDIQQLFARGNSYTVSPFRIVWQCREADEFTYKVAISVPKKKVPQAVDRNTIKRRVRELLRAYMQQPHPTQNMLLHIIIIYTHTSPKKYSQLKPELYEGLNRIFYTKNI